MTEIVKLKSKGQMTLPARVRQMAGLKTGDFLGVTITANVITLAPQSFIDRELAKSEADVKAGRTYGPFDSVDDMLTDLHKRAKQKRQQRKF